MRCTVRSTRILFVGLAALAVVVPGFACTHSTTGPGPSPSPHLVPRVDGDFWTIAHQPDLGSLGAPGQQPVDFAIWQAADGTWQLWSCIRYTKIGGDTRLFYAWEGASLTDTDWTPKGIAMEADPARGEDVGGLQAPHVIRVGDTFHMFYGTWNKIAHAVSTDGKTFTRVLGADGLSTVFSDGPTSGDRDPMTLAIDGTYHMVYAADDGTDSERTSTDLLTWSDRKVIARGGSAGTGPASAECPFLVHQPASGNGDYFLFRTQHYSPTKETRVYRSSAPDDFGIDDDSHLVGVLPLAAPEIVQVGSTWYVASVRVDYQGIELAKLAWAPAAP